MERRTAPNNHELLAGTFNPCRLTAVSTVFDRFQDDGNFYAVIMLLGLSEVENFKITINTVAIVVGTQNCQRGAVDERLQKRIEVFIFGIVEEVEVDRYIDLTAAEIFPFAAAAYIRLCFGQI